MENLQYFIDHLNFANTFWQVGTTLFFMLGDIISGVVSAVILKNLDSQKMREGLLRKVLLILIVLLGFVVGGAFNLTFISKAVCIYIIIMETISILENVKKAGIDLGRLGELLKIKQEDNTINLVVKKEDEESETK